MGPFGGRLSAMASTPSRQRNAVSEGVALGLVMCDRFTLPWNKFAVDLSFDGAWRTWQYSYRFPQVKTDIRNGKDGTWVITRADERKHTLNFYWDTGGPEISIYPQASWADGSVEVDQAAAWIDGGVLAEGWRDLAADLLRRLDD